jgi:predicted secreted Zn-dependent protease
MPQMLTARKRCLHMQPSMLDWVTCVKASASMIPILTCKRARPFASSQYHSLLGACMFGRKLLALSALLAIVTAPVEAKPSHKTRYVHYTVAGKSAAEILTSLHRRGPSVYGVGAYATTHADYSHQARAQQSTKSCRMSDFDYQIKFTIKLPQLSKSSRVKGKTLTAWSRFETFVKRHEETHRQIWLACAANHARQVAQLSASSCGKLQAQAAKLWVKNKAACDKKHASFDAAERGPLSRQPLIKQALRGH